MGEYVTGKSKSDVRIMNLLADSRKYCSTERRECRSSSWSLESKSVRRSHVSALSVCTPSLQLNRETLAWLLLIGCICQGSLNTATRQSERAFRQLRSVFQGRIVVSAVRAVGVGPTTLTDTDVHPPRHLLHHPQNLRCILIRGSGQPLLWLLLV